MPAPTYIISRAADPIFGVLIGLSAAATRINREEKDKGRTTQQTLEAARRIDELDFLPSLRDYVWARFDT
ncbi:hypothetical protein FOQG_02316 [Fusarium oxysporum f. sp. raphani 54005]|uniref:Non-classical export protein 1 n=7 Tax=Fusarium oxysporum species complex TaxID=171631 RepID=N1S124_FUSC4|nr:uncharacterized protein FOIG_03657 [Fusarium odoratissimum NRRL 54006]EMT68200.1 hypothetical protein FOC4_g10012612 [Fusarium odoratissimum]ENH68712.1 hypothetical protein FOC1_g10014498 [Fusarium oxysporum f. sp. cubense race 1]EXK96937.1 hypothetical protein FOQG_02316 [Fusarium oxysporum f. sp. raphani 54005]EXL79394.1 hypothetical protein FOPG_06672 [Fusarium oxysporum f. sp. conglutinans race 2 54008]KAF5256149.1 hypothetical protein FOXYS1_13391 [Fusarium oxysporum]KAH7486440.1 hypo